MCVPTFPEWGLMGKTAKAQVALGSKASASSHSGPPASRDGKTVCERPFPRKACLVTQLLAIEDAM